jgi:hypothetical protein
MTVLEEAFDGVSPSVSCSFYKRQISMIHAIFVKLRIELYKNYNENTRDENLGRSQSITSK